MLAFFLKNYPETTQLQDPPRSPPLIPLGLEPQIPFHCISNIPSLHLKYLFIAGFQIFTIWSVSEKFKLVKKSGKS